MLVDTSIWVEPSIATVEHNEALAFLEGNDLAGSGLGWIDVQLLASARLSGALIWTRDRNLAAAARKLRVSVTYG